MSIDELLITSSFLATDRRLFNGSRLSTIPIEFTHGLRHFSQADRRRRTVFRIRRCSSFIFSRWFPAISFSASAVMKNVGTKAATRISANVRTLATRRSRRISRCRRAAGVTFAHDARSRRAPGRAPCSAPACCSPSRSERRSMLGTSAANGAARIAAAEELQVLD